MKRITAYLILFGLILACACEGPKGPTGPQGPQGTAGEPGPGSRIVYQSTTPIPLEYWEVDVPEITLDDLPSVAVYLALPSPDDDLWFEAPLHLGDTAEDSWGYTLAQGQVMFWGVSGFIYKIVIII